MTTVDQRENSHVFSIMKGLGIIFVVAGHTAYSPVHNFVYLFHLAVFYFVAGYFFKDKYIDDKLLFVWKKIKSLWFPLIGYGIVFMLLHNLFFRAHFYNPLTSHLYTRQDYFDCLKYFCSCVTPEQLLGALWFLRSLFIVSFLFMLGVWLSKRLSGRYSDIILGGGILFAVGLCSVFDAEIQQINIPIIRRILSNECYLTAILYLGRMFRKYQRYMPVNIWSIAILLMLLLFLQYKSVTVEIVSSIFPPLPVFYFASVVGCLFTYILAVYIHKLPTLSRIMIYVGNASLTIMALHFLAFKVVSLLQILIYGYSIDYLSAFPAISDRINIWWIPYVCCGVALPLLYTSVKQMLVLQFGRLYNQLIIKFKL